LPFIRPSIPPLKIPDNPAVAGLAPVGFQPLREIPAAGIASEDGSGCE